MTIRSWRLLRSAFSRHHALQCGYCTPGMLATAYDIVTRLPDADEARIREELSGNLCRCTGYVGIVAAIRDVLADGPHAAHAARAGSCREPAACIGLLRRGPRKMPSTQDVEVSCGVIPVPEQIDGGTALDAFHRRAGGGRPAVGDASGYSNHRQVFARGFD